MGEKPARDSELCVAVTNPMAPSALATYIEGVRGSTLMLLIDKDGTAYLYYSAGKIYVAKLAHMTEIDGEPMVIDNLPTKGLLRAVHL